MIGNIQWDGRKYSLSIKELQDILPHIKVGDTLTFSILEIRNERNELVKRPKSITRMKMPLSIDYTSFNFYRKSRPSLLLKFSPSRAIKLNIGNNYRMAILILELNGEPLFPFELRCGGYGAEEFAKGLEKN